MESEYRDEERSEGKKMIWIIGGVILVIMIIALVYGATQRSIRSSMNASETPVIPGSSLSGTSSASTSVLGASETIETPVVIKGLEVVNLETFPQKVQAKVSYALANGCSVADAPVVSRSGKTILIVIKARAPKGAVCSQALVPGEVVVDLPVAGLSSGVYSVTSGKITKTFRLSQDNEIQYTSDK